MVKQVITFGEILLRLSTDRNLRFTQAQNFLANYGGGEFNVAVSLANYGISSEFITKIPKQDIGNSALLEMRKMNVKTNNVAFGGDRLGIYFLETGSANRSSNVIYDRQLSAFAQLEENCFDWERIFDGKDWFHWSGISPAVSQNVANECLKAIKTAHKKGLTISCDLNYRSKLWKYGIEPFEVMPELLKYCHVILGDIDTALLMLGKEKINANYKEFENVKPYYKQIIESCENLKVFATTIRYSKGASHQQIGGLLYTDDSFYFSDVKKVKPVVDRVGTGDAFMGGLIYGLLNKDKFTPNEIIDFAVAACCLKHTITGDYNLSTLEEVLSFVKGNTLGNVSR